ncbi:hypothetical protein AcV7_008478 [Taiwanofungus camphoratus]|nr:hypothetical protein AcV7_008478 [Antrodia cinnamomea]
MTSTIVHLTTTLPPSVDSPDVQRDLKFPFVPVRRRITRADAMEATKLAPFDSLPFALMPRRKQSMKPSIMHFGWLVEADDLLRYAEEHQIRVHRQEVSFSDEEDDDEEEEEEEEEANKPQLDPRRTMEAALGFMAGRLGLQFPDRSLSIEIPLRIGGFRIVSLYTNYYFKEIPSEDVIEVFGKELAKELKTDEVPKWYLDGINWHWV